MDSTTHIVSLRYLHIAPRKVRLLASTLRGLSIEQAEAQLLMRNQRSASPLLKLLRSAAANIRNNLNKSEANFVVSEIRVDQGPILKRSLPRAQGRATPLQKKMSHVTFILKERAPTLSRFNIVRPVKEDKEKKKNVSKSETPAKGSAKKSGAEKKSQDAGFFKKVFRRKSI